MDPTPAPLPAAATSADGSPPSASAPAATRPQWHAGAAVSTLTALVSLDPLGRATFDQQQVVAWLGRAVGPWSVRAVVGGSRGSQVQSAAGLQRLGDGWIAGLTAGRNYLPQRGWRPFINGTAALAAATAGTAAARWTAFDLRVGLDAGYTLARRLDLYALARAFGGPIFYRQGNAEATGTDRRHFQLGAAAALRIGDAFAVFGQVVPLGEVGGSVGVGVRW